MPRQGRSGGGRAPSRPTAPPSRPTPQQTRPATTAAYPPARTNQAAPPAPPAQQQQGSAGPGLFGQMASTAAYVCDQPLPQHSTNMRTQRCSSWLLDRPCYRWILWWWILSACCRATAGEWCGGDWQPAKQLLGTTKL
jgi:hypothetical protein